ncbi:MAG: DUF128 domain-containing protein [Archaeoglobaceae archaeon]|nr:DUF128 domain-containing protein [Archaeoglobaceae archaeon]
MMIGKGETQIEILKTLVETDKPLSCREITKLLNRRGINVSEKTIRKYIRNLTKKGYIKMSSSKATITEQGMETLKRATVFERLGEFRELVEYNMFNSTFNLYTLDGTVPTNLAIVDKVKIDECLELMKTVADAGLTTSRLITIVDEEESLGIIEVPKGKVGIGTISSTIYNVIMLNVGVVLGSEFAGLLQYKDSEPVGFTEMINYSGTTISPGLLFIRGGYTSVYEVARTGNGYVVTAVKSFNEYAYESVEREIMLANARGITGMLTISSPMDNKLNLPAYKKALLVVLAGVNHLAPLYEKGLNPELKINEVLVDFKEFKNIDKFI